MTNVKEERVLAEIKKWERELQHDTRSDFQRTLNRWVTRTTSEIPEEIKHSFFKKCDTCLFHLHSFIQNSSFQQDARTQILLAAKAFGKESIHQIDDLHNLSIDQINFLAENQTSKQRLYSFVQGGVTGTGGFLFAGVDIPAQTIINLRAVQLVAMCYGYEINTPYEMMTSLKVYHASLLPKHLQFERWSALKGEISLKDDLSYFYEGEDKVALTNNLDFLVKQIVKLSAISLFKKRLLAGIPVISIAIGASMNYQLTRHVSDFAKRYYQYRFIIERNNQGVGGFSFE